MAIFSPSLRSQAKTLLDELLPLSHPERVSRLIGLGRAARSEKKAAALLDELWRSEGDAAAYARRLVLKSCYGSGDGARILEALSDPSRLLRGGARKLIAMYCTDEQATEALKTTWYVRQHLPVLQALRKKQRTAPVDRFLDWLAAQSGETRLADCVPYGSEAAITRHLPAALVRPSFVFWEGMLNRAPRLLAQYLTAQLGQGSGQPDSQLRWVVSRSLQRLAVQVPKETCAVCDALLGRGVQPEAAVWPSLVRREPQAACAVALRHRLKLGNALFEKVALQLSGEQRAALLRSDCFALGDPQRWFRHLPESERRPVVAAWLDTVKLHPSYGVSLLRELARDAVLGRPEVIADAYARWSPAAQDRDGVIPRALVRELPPELAEREARRHLVSVTQLQTRPRERLPYAGHLGWDEATQFLKAYIGHPEGETRGQALSVLLSIAGWTTQEERRRTLVEEALKLVKARRNEQDPVRLLMLQALCAWPRRAWTAANLPMVGQILRDALDAADLSHATARAAEELVVRLFPIDGVFCGTWLATLIKERGTIYQPRLGDRLSDADVRAVAGPLLAVAKSWASREREGHLVQLVASLRERLALVPGLVDLLAQVIRDTATAGVSLALMTLLGKHERPRFLALINDVSKHWLKRSWDSALIGLASAQERGEVPEPLVAALEEVLYRAVHQGQASMVLSVLAQRAPLDFRRIVPKALERDQSFICLPVVYEYLHRKRTDLLTPCLGTEVIRGRFATGKTGWVLPFADGFFRWTPEQQQRFSAQLTRITDDRERDTPTVFWALTRIPELLFLAPVGLIRLADDPRAAVLEKAVRTLGRCDAGQGVEKLLACLEDARARYAIYALRRAVLELPPKPGLALLQKVPMQKVTVAKEVVRLLGELRSEAAYAALLGLDSPTLHRDIRIALLRALWDHLEREPTWQLLRRAATGPDWILASRVGDIPPDRLTTEVDRRLSEVMALVLGRPEPEARLELLRRAPSLPMKDLVRTFFAACLARLDSRFSDEVTAALSAVLGRAQEGDLPAIVQALARLRPNRSALAIVTTQVLAALPPRSKVYALVADALVASLADDERAVPTYLRCALRVHGEPLRGQRWLEILGAVAAAGRLHGEALAAAQEVIRALPVSRLPIAELTELEARLAVQQKPELRLLSLAVLSTVAGPGNGQGWTPERRARLETLRRDPAPLVAGAAEFCFPPAEEPPTAAS